MNGEIVITNCPKCKHIHQKHILIKGLLSDERDIILCKNCLQVSIGFFKETVPIDDLPYSPTG